MTQREWRAPPDPPSKTQTLAMINRPCLFVMVATSALGTALIAEDAQLSFTKDGKPLLETYCYGCHNPEKKKADLDLTAFTAEDQVAKNRKVWTTALDMVRHSEMPPEEKKQPSAKEREILGNWIEQALNALDCKKLQEPGQVTIRRLNRAEYNNTMRDLLGLDLRPADDFPSDDVGYGFDNIGEVLSMPPLLMEKYYNATQQILDQAIVPEPVDQRYVAAKMTATSEGAAPAEKDKPAPAGHLVEGESVIFMGKGEVAIDVNLPTDGRYILKASASGLKAGNAPVRMGLMLDGKIEKGFSVTGDFGSEREFQAPIKSEKGNHTIAVSFLNPYTDARALDPAKKDRKLKVDWIEISGPIVTPTAAQKQAHQQIFIAEAGKGLDERQAAAKVIEHFASRAFRRPIDSGTVDKLMTLYDKAKSQKAGYANAVRPMIEATLLSPRFLFRIEQEDTKATGPYRVDEFDLAARLSYFIWSTTPDDALLELASAKKLSNPATLEKQVKRMLADPKSRALAENFAGQWFQIRSLAGHRPDRKKYPEYTSDLRHAMTEEVAMFIDEVIREDRPVTDLIDADYTYLNEPLAELYEIKGIKGQQMRRVKLKDRKRGGVMTMASVLTLTSDPERTNVPKRGKYVAEAILGTPPPPPPPVVPALEDSKDGAKKNASLRELLEVHRKDPVCASCHAKIDPLGFGLENYDPLGRWRTKSGEHTVDASGVLPGGQKFEGPEALKILMDRKDQFKRNMAEKMLTYALGRGLDYYDACATKDILDALDKNNDQFSAMVIAIARSFPFQYRKN